MQIVFRARDVTEAHIVAGLLNANGVETHVGGHYLQGGVGDLAAMNFANIQVADFDVESAKVIIAKYESEPIQARKEKKTDRTTSTSRILVAIFVAAVSILISFLIFLR